MQEAIRAGGGDFADGVVRHEADRPMRSPRLIRPERCSAPGRLFMSSYVVADRGGDQPDPSVLQQRDGDSSAGYHAEMVQHRAPQGDLALRRDRQFERHR
jgi:hypothetical protein